MPRPRGRRDSAAAILIAATAPLVSGAVFARAALPSFTAGITTGSIQNAAITEASGIAASRINQNVLWTFEDSGNPATVYAMTPAGVQLASYSVTGAGNTDWEDIAVGPGPAAGTQYLYIGDIGDNNAVRASVAVYRVPEPSVSDTQSPVTTSLAGASKFTFNYPNGARDAESLFVDPLTKDVYIISKRDTVKYVYRAAFPQSTSGTTTLEQVATLDNANWITAADISPDGSEIIMRAGATTTGLMYTRPAGASVADALATTPIGIPLLSEAQGEAIGFDPQGWGYYTTSEGANAPIHYFDRLPPPAHAMYWDNDAVAAGSHVASGAGMGGSGTWSASALKWYNGSSDVAWAAGDDAIFWGTAGTVTLSAAQNVNSMTFKSSGYVVTGSTLTMSGSAAVAVDAGMSATINSVVAGTSGVTKSGAGMLILGGSNTYSGGTTVSGGTLRISADSALGAVPGGLATNITLNGGTLQFGASFDLANTRGINLGALGGTIDTNGFSNPSGYSPTNGFRGAGDFTKIGAGTFFASATTGGSNTLWTGRLILRQGTWKIVASDGLPYNVPAADGLKAAQVTLDGGTWQMGATINVTNGRRGITVDAGGGTIDTQSFDFTWAGPLAGGVASATLIKTGAGTLRFTGASGTASTYAGIFNINAGTLRLDAGITMGDLASVNVAGGATLNVTGNETIGSLAGSGAVTLANVTFTTGGNNASTPFAGDISGSSGSINKSGTGTMTLSGANSYGGGTTVSAGKLLLASSLTSSSSFTVQSGAVAELAPAGNVVLKTSSLAINGTGKLDLADNKLIVSGGDVAAVTALVKSGFNLGGTLWAGSGITTSLGTSITAVGVILNDYATIGQPSGPIYTSFGGETAGVNDVLVKYTYVGDADLSGAITSADYFQIDIGFLAQRTGWINGDFDYNGVINSSDYFLIDNAFLQQSTLLVPSAATAVPEPASLGAAVFMLLALPWRRRRVRILSWDLTVLSQP